MSRSDLKTSVSGVPPDNYSVIVIDGLPVLSNDTNPFTLYAEENDVTVTTEPQDITCKK